MVHCWHQDQWVPRRLVPELDARLDRAAELDEFGHRMARAVAECADTHADLVDTLGPKLRKIVDGLQRGYALDML